MVQNTIENIHEAEQSMKTASPEQREQIGKRMSAAGKVLKQ